MPIPHHVSDLHDKGNTSCSTLPTTHQSRRSIATQNKLEGRCTPCGTSERSECAMKALFGRRRSADSSARRRGKAWLGITCRRVFPTDFTFATVVPAFGGC